MSRILMAEDDPTSRVVLRQTLARAGYDIVVAKDGEAAWASWQSSPDTQLVVLDWDMPGLTGLEVCRRIRKASPKRYVYVLLLTGKTESPEIVAGLDAGADDYLTKPYHPDELAARLRVGERLLRLQNENLRYQEEMENLLRRHDLLGQILCHTSAPQDAPSATPDAAPDASEANAGNAEDVAVSVQRDFSPDVAGLRPVTSFDRTIIHAAARMGLGPPEPFGARDASATGGFASISSVWVKPLCTWLDLELELDRASAVALGLRLLGTLEIEEREMVNLLCELHGIVQSFWMSAFQKEGIAVLAPLAPTALEVPRGEQARPSKRYGRYDMAFAGVRLSATILEHTAPVLTKDCAQLQVGDVLAAAVPGLATKEFHAGRLLDGPGLRRFLQIAADATRNLACLVIEPSSLARAACRPA